jgi:hypothetical protein
LPIPTRVDTLEDQLTRLEKDLTVGLREGLKNLTDGLTVRQDLQKMRLDEAFELIADLRNQIAALKSSPSSPAPTQAEALSETINQAPTTQAAPVTEPTAEPRPIDLTPKVTDSVGKAQAGPARRPELWPK